MKLKRKYRKYILKHKFCICPYCNGELRQKGATTDTIFFESNYVCLYCGNQYYYYSTKFLQSNNFFEYNEIKLLGKDKVNMSKDFLRKQKIINIKNVQKRNRKKIFSR